MKLIYIGPQAGGVDVVALGIVAWKPHEIQDVPESIALELIQRGDFKPVESSRKAKASDS